MHINLRTASSAVFITLLIFWPSAYVEEFRKYGVPEYVVDWLSPPYIGSSSDAGPREHIRNYVGAATFLSYIVAALVLTGALLRALTSTKTSALRKDLFRSKTNGQIALTLLSFTLLSSNMILFLVQNYYDYQAWLGESSEIIPLAQGVWRWMTTSTLFIDFAHGLCADPLQTWWATQALFATYLTFYYICFAGKSLATTTKISLLGQILPPSFSLNLFYLSQNSPDSRETQAKIQSKRVVQTSKFTLRSIILSIADFTLLIGYRGLLASLPSLAWSSNPLLYVAVIRILLFAPWFTSGAKPTDGLAIERAMQTWAIASLLLALSSPQALVTFILHSNAAARTLGLDLFVWSMSVLFQTL